MGDYMKTRNQIPNEYKWDLELYSNDDEIEKTFKKINEYISKIASFNGKLGEKNKFFEYCEFDSKYSKDINKLAFYIQNNLSTDNSDVKMLKLSERLSIAYSKLTRASSFVMPQLFALTDEYLESLLSDKRAKNLDNFIREIIRLKPHKLDESTNLVISKLNRSFNSSSNVFDILSDSEIPFENALDNKGKSHEVNDAVYSKYVSSSDRTLRENAFNSIMNGYSKFNKTLAELYLSSIRHDTDFAKLKNFNSVLESELIEDDIPKVVFEKNIENVNRNLPLLHEYVQLRKNFSKNSKFAYFDLFESMKLGGKISLTKAKETILSALKCLGDDYVEKVNKKLNDKSIDYLPNKNKASGAYCSHCYGAKTLILMNYTEDYNSMSTLIHEMGHCINSEYFLSSQPYEKANITIFAAEIASTVNEILLNQYMQNHCKKSEKLALILEFLEQVRSTIFRQTLFSEFELYAHTAVENEQPITYEELNKKYYELNKKYYGTKMIIPKNLAYEWSRIPHFYRPYYVYSYSTGLICAIIIANKVMSDYTFAKKYIEFLKNGTNKNPVDMLKDIGIDLTQNSSYELAFDFIKEQLKEFKKLTQSN